MARKLAVECAPDPIVAVRRELGGVWATYL